MARPIEEFTFAWKSLSGVSEGDGWRSIPVISAGPCSLHAGRRFPGNEECMLVRFPSVKIPLAEKLPEGIGFAVERVDPHGDGKTWLALTRKDSGSIDLYASMVSDVIMAMDHEGASGEDRLLRVFLGRVRAWQEFMRKGRQALNPEAEIGLIGELSFLDAILKAGFPSLHAVEAWMGPFDGIQDFEIGTGAVEVKATASSSGFPVKIGSIEQLDDSIRKPLFIAGVKLIQRESGLNLPDFVEIVRERMKNDAEAARLLAERLLAAGYHDSYGDRYPRRFSLDGWRILEVTENFPRIVSGNVPIGIRRVIYEIDLDRVQTINVDVTGALKALGVI
jgi:hypothetical protein